MKKVIMLLVLIFATISVGAQIKRNFDGIILGKTTKSEVKSYLSKKNYNFKEISARNTIKSSNEVSQGGYVWPCVYYCFYNDILYNIKFHMPLSYGDIYKTYKILRENLYKKYVKKIPRDNSNDKTPETKIKDKSSYVKLNINYNPKFDWYLNLSYVDMNLENQLKKHNFDDL